jgi:hypothetical protein
MEAGYIADRTYGGFTQEKWSAGEPKPHWWGMEPSRESVPVTTMRCPNCGALESFARAE